MLEKKTISIEGITCRSCEKSVKEALEKLGVEKVCVDIKSGKVGVEYNSCKVDYDKIKGEIENLGYKIRSKCCC